MAFCVSGIRWSHHSWFIGSDGISLTFCLSWTQTGILTISASQVARITVVSHHTGHYNGKEWMAHDFYLKMLPENFTSKFKHFHQTLLILTYIISLSISVNVKNILVDKPL
jgi:hypothetical protein